MTRSLLSRSGLAISLVAGVSAVATACGSPPAAEGPPPPPPPGEVAEDGTPLQPATPAGADAFVAQTNRELKELWTTAERAAWVKSNFITHDTEQMAAHEHEKVLEYTARRIKEAQRFEKVQGLSPDTKRMLYLLKYSAGIPAPSDATKRKRLAEITTQLESMYGKGKTCSPKFKGHGVDKTSECLTLQDLSKLLSKSRNYDLLLEAWKGWRSISPPMRPLYQEMVSLGNEGARELGFRDVSDIWKGGYDMSAESFHKEMDRLWVEVKPLYEKLHCFARGRLRTKYGKDKIAEKAPIPAHLLGNMWAQEWGGLYKEMEPYPGKGEADMTKQLVAKKYDALKMVKLGEGFFTSLGMDPLPKTFYERSLFLKPKDREVECHASAWDVNMEGDLRIKMCIEVNHEDLVTIHHELGHNYYFHYYKHLPVLYQAGANDGFHEGIGDTLALSVTPGYLAKVGLIAKAPSDAKAELNVLMQRALEGIAFLPFGKMIDEWRWDVFSGKTPPSKYNEAWWALRKKYQGIVPPAARSENDFDPGAKYHIPSNVPYTRYFIARILQYQFHRALCKVAGHTGPLHTCSIHGNKAAGEKMIAMLKLGASEPWPEALKAMTGQSRMDATAIIDYYKPLIEWLDAQNKGQQCGWE